MSERLRIRPEREGARPVCAVVGCVAYPGMELYHRRFCAAHAKDFRTTLGQRLYNAFLAALSQSGVRGEPRLYRDSRLITSGSPCSVPDCGKEPITGPSPFAPFKQGYVFLCESHSTLHEQLVGEHSGEQLLWQWESRRRTRSETPRKRIPGRRGAGKDPRTIKAERLLKQEMTKRSKEYPDVRSRYSFILKQYVFPRCIKNYDGLGESNKQYEEKKLKQALAYWNLGPPRTGGVIPARLSR